jgi:hypothetical protein
MQTDSLAEIASSVASLQETLEAFAERTEAAVEQRTSSIIERLSSSLGTFEGSLDSLLSLASTEALSDDDRTKQLVAALAGLMLKNLRTARVASKLIELKTFALETYSPALYDEQVPAIVLDIASGSKVTEGLTLSVELLTNPATIEQLIIDTKENYNVTIEPLSGHIFFTEESQVAAQNIATEIGNSMRQGGIVTGSYGNSVVVSNAISVQERENLLNALLLETGWIVKYLSKEADSKIELSFADRIDEIVSKAAHPFDFISSFQVTGQVHLAPETKQAPTANDVNDYQRIVVTALSQLLGTRVFVRLNLPELVIKFLKDMAPVEQLNFTPGQVFNPFNGKLSDYLAPIFTRQSQQSLAAVLSFGDLIFRVTVKPRGA